MTSKELTNANVFNLSICLLHVRHFISYTYLYLCSEKIFKTGMHRDSINGGMAETAEMAERVGFQFAMFMATLILY